MYTHSTWSVLFVLCPTGTTYCTLYTVLSTGYTLHTFAITECYILELCPTLSIYFTLYSALGGVPYIHNILYAVFFELCTSFTIHCTLYSLYCAQYSQHIYCRLSYSMYCALLLNLQYAVLFQLCPILSALYQIDCIWCSTFCTLYCTFCAMFTLQLCISLYCPQNAGLWLLLFTLHICIFYLYIVYIVRYSMVLSILFVLGNQRKYKSISKTRVHIEHLSSIHSTYMLIHTLCTKHIKLLHNLRVLHRLNWKCCLLSQFVQSCRACTVCVEEYSDNEMSSLQNVNKRNRFLWDYVTNGQRGEICRYKAKSTIILCAKATNLRHRKTPQNSVLGRVWPMGRDKQYPCRTARGRLSCWPSKKTTIYLSF
jgi:hypothetical protein